MIFQELGIDKIFIISIIVAMQIELIFQGVIDFIIDPLVSQWTSNIEYMKWGKMHIGSLLNVVSRSVLIVVAVYLYAHITKPQ